MYPIFHTATRPPETNVEDAVAAMQQSTSFIVNGRKVRVELAGGHLKLKSAFRVGHRTITLKRTLRNSCLQRNAKKLQVTAVSSGEDLAKASNTKLDDIPHGLSTNSEVAQRDATSTVRSSADMFEFIGQLSMLMGNMESINRDKDNFLRQLLSNAADALNMMKFLSLTDKKSLGEGDNVNLEIQIKLDKEKKILSIRDRGIGMTREDLINYLGTVGASGTAAFVEKMQPINDLHLIGRAGCGFSSVFSVADNVMVITKHNSDKQYVWESEGWGTFTLT